MNSYYIQDICSIKGGKRIPKGETLQIEPNGHPYIRILDMAQGRVLNISSDMQYAREKYLNKIKKYIVHTDDVILSIVGSLGLVSVIGPSLDGANLTENCCKFVDIDESRTLPMFLYYALISPFNQDQIKKFQVGSMQPKLPMYNIQKLLIPKIPIGKQQKIINVLSPLDSKLENNNKINSESESLAKTIYDYWFLQFDFPNEEGKPYKSSGGTMEYNEQLKMEIPKGWEVKKLGDLTTLDLGGTPKTEEDSYWNGDINWLNSGEVAQFPVVCTEAKITNEGMNNSATKMMKKGTVVVSITGNIRTSILGIDSCGNQSIVGIRETDKLKKSYIYPNICHLLDHYVHLSTGNCQQHINKEALLQTNIIVPPDHLLDKYYEIVEPMYEQIINNGNESFELASLRDYLLPLLMNGQVGFKDE